MPKDKKTPLAGGVGNGPKQKTDYGQYLNTPVSPPVNTATYSEYALSLLADLHPWNTWQTVVEPVPYVHPLAVATSRCRFCGGSHIFLGRVGVDDPGIRRIKCRPEDMQPEWLFPPMPTRTVLIYAGVVR